MKSQLDVFNYPLSHQQKSLWFLNKLYAHQEVYDTGFAIQINSELDVSALQDAFQNLIDRHPVLTTTFEEVGGELIQITHPNAKVAFKEIEGSHWSEEELKNQIILHTKKRLDLNKGPIFCVTLFRQSKQSHILLINIHHIVDDGSSRLILLDELFKIYAATLSGESTALPKLETTYQDFVSWQQALIQSPEGEIFKKYWEYKLSGDLPPFLFSNSQVTENQIAQKTSFSFELNLDLSKRIKVFAADNKATAFVVLLTAFNALLYRLTDQPRIIVGSPMMGRTLSKFRNTMGYFVNELPLATDFSSDLTVKALLNQVKITVMACIKHQNYPFSLIVKDKAPDRNAHRHPIFQVAFTQNNLGGLQDVGKLMSPVKLENPIKLGGLSLSAYPLPREEGHLDLELNISELEGIFLGHFFYDKSLFPEEIIQRFSGYYNQLLEAMIQTPDVCIQSLNFISTQEKNLLLTTFNNTEADYPQDKCIHQLFIEQAQKTPNQLAVVFEDQTITYQELDQKSTALALYLQSLGVKPDQLVGLSTERTLFMLIGIVGILKSGGAYVPLDPTYPQDRLDFMIQDSKIKIVLTEELIKEGMDFIVSQSLKETVSSNNLAYIIYTSGSTGKPKGVMIEHCSFINMIVDQIKALKISAEDRFLQFASQNFDASVFEIFMALFSGATLVIIPNHKRSDKDLFSMYLNQHQVTAALLSPSFIKSLQKDSLSCLKTLITGGESANPEELRYFAKDKQVINAYGPTEISVMCTTYRLNSEENDIPIGKPIANTSIYVLDANLQLLPIRIPSG